MISKTKKLAVAFAIATIALPIATASASTASKYNAWKSATLPVIQRISTDYARMQIDLNNNNVSAVVNDLHALGNDALVANRHANSPDALLNFDFSQFAVSVSGLSSAGLAYIGQTGSLASWRNAIINLGHQETVTTNRIKFDNNRW